jgi:hypothetical protein
VPVAFPYDHVCEQSLALAPVFLVIASSKRPEDIARDLACSPLSANHRSIHESAGAEGGSQDLGAVSTEVNVETAAPNDSSIEHGRPEDIARDLAYSPLSASQTVQTPLLLSNT